MQARDELGQDEVENQLEINIYFAVLSRSSKTQATGHAQVGHPQQATDHGAHWLAWGRRGEENSDCNGRGSCGKRHADGDCGGEREGEGDGEA